MVGPFLCEIFPVSRLWSWFFFLLPPNREENLDLQVEKVIPFTRFLGRIWKKSKSWWNSALDLMLENNLELKGPETRWTSRGEQKTVYWDMVPSLGLSPIYRDL